MMPIILAVSPPEHPTLLDTIHYQSFGFWVLIGVLGALAVILVWLGKILGRAEVRAERSTAIALPSVASSSPVSAPSANIAGAITAQTPVAPEEVPPEVFAVIAAALSVVLREPHAILAIEGGYPAPMDPRRLAWSMEGRRQIFGSHQTR